MELKIALAQIDIALGHPTINFHTVARVIQQAAANADVVVLPEMWNTGYALADLVTLADLNGQQTQAFLCQMARKYHIAIIGGSVATKRNQHFYNTTYVYDKNGVLVGSYDKVHLFGLMHEDQYLQAGNQKNYFALDGVKSASFICYDLRFPEWFRTVAQNEVDVIYVVAEWPAARIEQWETLLKARAIENQAFVVAVNRIGEDAENTYNGHSLVVDPLGQLITDAGEKAGITIAELNLGQLATVREPIPVFKDRRPDLYD